MQATLGKPPSALQSRQNKTTSEAAETESDICTNAEEQSKKLQHDGEIKKSEKKE